ncbi:probable glutamate receptor [Penaeus monodon]|uniref:probable glutamate receptor n=1 Tax=Penaeus monodon TaxID=6687 RepID=UPI0018A7D0DC|nr:probable glutamate receptor [Penaeus monodon]
MTKTLSFGVMTAPVDDPLRHRSDLTGLHLACTTIQYHPLTALTLRPNNTVTVEGVLGSFFQEMASRTNFTYACRQSRDGQWGVLVGGAWTGIIRDIIDGEADIGVAALDITLKRSEVISYLHTILAGDYRIFMRKTSSNNHIWSAYSKPFSVSVWLAVITLVVSFVVMIRLTTQFSPLQEPLSLSDSTLVISGFVCCQGTSFPLLSISCRTVALVWLVLQVILVSYYTSDLVSSLAAGPPPPSLSTLHDVLNTPSYDFGFEKGSALHQASQQDHRETFLVLTVTLEREFMIFCHIADWTKQLESKDILLQKIWKSIKDGNYQSLANSMEAGMKRVYEEPYLFIESEIPLRYSYGHDCRLFMLPTSYFPVKISFALKKNSPLVPVLNGVALDILSSGLPVKWWQDWRREIRGCRTTQFEPVDLKVVVGPFLILTLALATSSFFLAFEILTERRKIRGRWHGTK